MPISDPIKFPYRNPLSSQTVSPYLIPKLPPVNNITFTARLNEFKKKFKKPSEKQKQSKAVLSKEKLIQIKSMIRKLNNDLEQQGILIHLILIKDEDGYAIDVYDCTDENCAVVSDLIINIDDMPSLLRNLQKESGMLIDQVL
jgi:hypothetical protein